MRLEKGFGSKEKQLSKCTASETQTHSQAFENNTLACWVSIAHLACTSMQNHLVDGS